MSLLLSHPTKENLRGYVDGALNVREACLVRMHCIQCKACSDSVLDLFLGKKTLEQIKNENKFSTHITRDKLVLYVSNKLDLGEQEEIAIHCALCEDCEKSFKSIMNELGPPKRFK